MALTFEYKVRDRAGKLVQGQLEGDSMALVVGRLARDGVHAHFGHAQVPGQREERRSSSPASATG